MYTAWSFGGGACDAPAFARVMAGADLVTPDGMPLAEMLEIWTAFDIADGYAVLRYVARLLEATGEAVVLSANFGPAALHADEEW